MCETRETCSSTEVYVFSHWPTNTSFKLPIIISRSSNNYGPYQFPEKLIPLSIINALNEKKINIYGNGLQIRNWIHVDDNNNAIIEIIKKGKLSNIYNIGHNNEITNLKVVKYICYILNDVLPRKNKKNYTNLINFVKDRPGHDIRYAQSIKKIKKETSWKPNINLKNGLKQTIFWYLENKEWWEEIIKNKYSGKRLGQIDKK